EVGDEVATRKAYGPALSALAEVDPRVVALDGEVSNSTGVADFVEAHPERFFEMFIAEQQMVAAATGLSTRGYIAYASSFAAFLTRAADFIRMAPVSRADLRLVGSHAGVEIGADGPSQMGLEDLAMIAATQGSTVLYPSDATSTAALVAAMADVSGVSYLRTTRGGYPVLYGPDEEFPVGGSKTLRSSPEDAVTLIGAGVTLHEALAAAQTLAEEGVSARVIDAYSIKPIDGQGIREAVTATGGRVVVAEDHHAEGGLGAAGLAALASEPVTDLHLRHLAVDGAPGSGTTEQLLDWAGIDAAHIAAAARAAPAGCQPAPPGHGRRRSGGTHGQVGAPASASAGPRALPAAASEGPRGRAVWGAQLSFRARPSWSESMSSSSRSLVSGTHRNTNTRLSAAKAA